MHPFSPPKGLRIPPGLLEMSTDSLLIAFVHKIKATKNTALPEKLVADIPPGPGSFHLSWDYTTSGDSQPHAEADSECHPFSNPSLIGTQPPSPVHILYRIAFTLKGQSRLQRSSIPQGLKYLLSSMFARSLHLAII